MIGALVLAAGESRRLGRAKQLLRTDGEPLVRRTARVALEAGCSPVVVVLGAGAERVAAALDGLALRRCVHPGWRDGMGSSIAAGVAALDAETVAATLVLACDQPALDVTVLRRLLDGFDGVPGRRVAAAYAGTVGVPALFERSLFPELRQLTGDRGAREVLLAEPALLRRIPWEPGARDIDHPGDG